MKKLRLVVSVLFILVLLLSVSPCAFALVEPDSSFYVTDSANVLTEETAQMIISFNGALEQQCRGAQIVVVTVDYLDGMTCDDYAYQLFNDWGVGSPENNNGMLLLLSTQENKAWLAYGLGLNATLSSSDVDELLDTYFWKDFDRGNYDKAVSKLFPALLRYYDGVYGTNISLAAKKESDNSRDEYNNPYAVLRVLVIILILLALFNNNGRRGTRGGSWLPWLLFMNSAARRFGGGWSSRGGRGGFGGGGFGGGFGGGMGRGGGGFSGGGGGRR